MKKAGYFPWMGLIPLVLGAIYIRSVGIPWFGGILFTVLPWATVAIWVWLGHCCGRDGHRWLTSVLCGHWGVALVAVCAVWQFGLLSSEARDLPVALFGQYLVGLVPLVIPVVVRFIMVEHTIESTPMILYGTLMTAVALIALFSLGYWFGRKRKEEKFP